MFLYRKVYKYLPTFSLQAMALADMGRVDDALPILRSVLDIDKPSEADKHTFFEETVCIANIFVIILIIYSGHFVFEEKIDDDYYRCFKQYLLLC